MKRALAICLAGLFSSGAMAADLMQVYQDALANDAKFAAARAQLPGLPLVFVSRNATGGAL